MSCTSFLQVVSDFRAFGPPNNDEACDAIERLERVILDHRPSSPIEAAAMLEVVIPSVSAGGRSDGRDVEALQRIRGLLAASV